MKIKSVIAGIIGIVILSLGFYLVIRNRSSEVAIKSESNVNSDLVISPQDAKEGVTVNSVVMHEDGYVVTRAIDNNRLGQIIEPSKYLKKVEYKDVKISLGDFYNGEELIVIIHKDDGNGYFNDMDQPATDANGKYTARYVKTGQLVPDTVLQPSQDAMAGHMMTVRYTNKGFEPATIEIPVGTMVQFINDSDDNMWVASNEHPGHGILPTFDQFGFGKKGSTYTYTFDKIGTWPFHDHINLEREGIIKVIEK